MADTDKILSQKIRNPNPQSDNKWLTTLHVTADEKLHLYGCLETEDAVSGENIQDGVISNSHIGKDTITGGEEADKGNIAPNTIHQYNLAEEQMINSTRLVDFNIVRNKIARQQISRSRIRERHVGAKQIGSKAIYPRHLSDNFFQLIKITSADNNYKLVLMDNRYPIVEDDNYSAPNGDWNYQIQEDLTLNEYTFK